MSPPLLIASLLYRAKTIKSTRDPGRLQSGNPGTAARINQYVTEPKTVWQGGCKRLFSNMLPCHPKAVVLFTLVVTCQSTLFAQDARAQFVSFEAARPIL
jgi:hypothetical protein